MFPVLETETLTETKTCKHCGADFPITVQDLAFYDKISPVFSGKKYAVPTPTLCPDCRRQRRFSLRNLRNLYKGTCALTGKSIMSIYSPDKPYVVYDQDVFWSDVWDPLEYGRDFDFGRPFFEQFDELFRAAPHLSLVNLNATNSTYTNGGVGNKDCYLIFASSENEKSYYGFWYFQATGVFDSSFVYESSECYECFDVEKCHRCFFSERLQDCSDCVDCVSCVNCHQCVECDGLSNASYHIHNRKVSPEEYAAYLQKRGLSKSLRKPAKIVRYANVSGCENCIGENLRRGEEGKSVFWGQDFQSCRYDFQFFESTDTADTDFQKGTSRVYESYAIEEIADSVGIYLCANIARGFYNYSCFSCQDCFGCSGLRNKQYCILNKQYSKEEYETLVPKIIAHMVKTGEWGEFFPSSISPFGYNETMAQEYFPLTREEALAKGFNWSDYESPFPKVEKTIPAAKLPSDIAQVPDDILNWAIECEVTKKPFRIIKQELEFYRKHNLPIPRRHPDQRHLDRMALRNPKKLFERACDCPDCAKNNATPDGKSAKFFTTYSPERPEKIYCEKCYAKEFLG